MDRLIELFRAMTTPSRKSVQGLWAELFLIAQSRQPTILVDAWHMLPEDRYDFAMDDQRIEVKSFSGSLRQHHFSLEQLQPPEGVKTLIASMLVEGFTGRRIHSRPKRKKYRLTSVATPIYYYIWIKS